MEFRIDELLDGFEEQEIRFQTADYTSADKIKELTMKKIKQEYSDSGRRHGVRKLFTVLLAAVLVMALTAGALAVFSVHRKRQQQLREALHIEENRVESYVEYDEPQEEARPSQTEERTVTLVSAIRNQGFQQVYVTLSPVSREEALEATAGEVIGYSVNGGISGSYMDIPYDTNLQPKDRQELQDLKMDYSYDEQTQTLLLACKFSTEDWPENEPVTLQVLRINGFKFEEVYGSVTFELTALETRRIFFDTPVELYNSTLEKKCRVAGVELTPTSAAYLVEIEDGESLFSPRDHMTDEEREILMSWILCTDEPLCGAAVIFADGSEFATGCIVSSPYEDGYVRHEASWTAPVVDIHAVTAVRIGDEVRQCP